MAPSPGTPAAASMASRMRARISSRTPGRGGTAVGAAATANRRKLLVLVALALLAAAAYMLVEVNFDNQKLFAYSMRIRAPKLAAMAIAAVAIGGATIVFQSIINNTIVTPCLLGMNALYSLIHTVVAFAAGMGSAIMLNANLSFAVDLLIMGTTATLLYSYLFKKTRYNVLYVLLIGTVLTSFFGSIQSTLACEPDVIFIGGRLSSSFEALSEIAPVVYLATDVEKGVVESTMGNACVIAQMFGLEDQVDELVAGFDARIAALKEFADGKTAVMGMCTSGSFNVLGNDGRCSLIGREVGFTNVAAGQVSSSSRGGSSQGGKGGETASQGGQGSGQGGEAIAAVTATHGNEASFETIVSLDPDYIFVMDRDAAIGTAGASLAPEIMENELVMNTRAYQDGHLVYLEHPGVWYVAEGGVTALQYMLTDLEVGLGLAEAPAADEEKDEKARA